MNNNVQHRSTVMRVQRERIKMSDIHSPQIHGETSFNIREAEDIYRMHTRSHCEEVHSN